MPCIAPVPGIELRPVRAVLAVLAVVCAVPPGAGSGSASEPRAERAIASPEGRAGYSVGYEIGRDLLRQGRTLDPDSLRLGLRDGLDGAEPSLPVDEMNALLLDVKRGAEADEWESRRDRVRRVREAGAEFLAENAGREGVTELASGLQYRVLRQGEGRQPGPEDTVTVHYRARRIDGATFHDSWRAGAGPERLRVDGVIPGLGEALQRMREGGRWELVIPAHLAYGEKGPLAHRTVIYEVELVSIATEAAR